MENSSRFADRGTMIKFWEKPRKFGHNSPRLMSSKCPLSADSGSQRAAMPPRCEKRDELASPSWSPLIGGPAECRATSKEPGLFLSSILCLPKAPGCQLFEAATSVGCRFLGSSRQAMRLTVYGRYTDFGLRSLGLNVRFGS